MSIVLQILFTSFSMFWEVFWPLIFGFILSAIVQAVVSRQTVAKNLGNDSPRSLVLATLFGIASSSCSYAAVALSRSLFQKGASFTAAMIFELASTNLVIELGFILFILLGWRFVSAEFIGGGIMIVIIVLLFKYTLTKKLITSARQQVTRGLHGKMEGHAEMDMSIQQLKGKSLKSKVDEILTAVANYFVMDIVSIWVDVVLGFLLAGIISVTIPQVFWHAFFLTDNSALSMIIGPLVGPIVAMISFVCSVGNIPLAVILWQGGMSFGGIVSFILADLLILPILNIYRKYYGWKMTEYIFVTFYIAMVGAGYGVELLFGTFHMIPTNRHISIIFQSVTFDSTSLLNITFLVITAYLVYTFIKKGGLPMVKMMDKN